MPARPTPPERRVPGRGLGLARLGRLPQREVVHVALRAADGRVVGCGDHVVDRLAREGAVVLERPHVEVHVTGPGLVRVPGVDERAHQVDHRGHVTGRARLVRRGQHAQRVVRGGERALVRHRPRPPLDARLGGLGEDLVVDVGHVAHERHAQALAAQPADEHVERDARPDVADVGRRLHRRTAQVDADLAVDPGDEVAHRAGGGVVQAKTHAGKATGASLVGRARRADRRVSRTSGLRRGTSARSPRRPRRAPGGRRRSAP
ncbi:hypothetical protein CPER28S_02318 [Cellulomonas persica]